MTERRINPLYASAQKVIEMMAGQPLRQVDKEYGVPPQQRMRLGRYVGRYMLLGGDHFDDEFTYAAATNATRNLKEHGFLHPSVSLGIFPLFTGRDESNDRLMRTHAALHESIKDQGVVPHDIKTRANVLHGSDDAPVVRGSETVRAYNALDGAIRSFERDLGYGPKEEPEPQDVALIGIVRARWASGIFRGINHMELSESGRLAVLRDTGDITSEHRWANSLANQLVIPAHD